MKHCKGDDGTWSQRIPTAAHGEADARVFGGTRRARLHRRTGPSGTAWLIVALHVLGERPGTAWRGLECFHDLPANLAWLLLAQLEHGLGSGDREPEGAHSGCDLLEVCLRRRRV